MGAFTVTEDASAIGFDAATVPNNTELTFPRLVPVNTTRVPIGPVTGVYPVIVGKEAAKDTDPPVSDTVNVELGMNAFGVNVSRVELTLVTVPEVYPPVMVTDGDTKLVPLMVIRPLAA